MPNRLRSAAKVLHEERPHSRVTVQLNPVFNSIVDDMLSDMSNRFPGNKELAACLTFHRMGAKANVRLPYEKFVEYAVIPYGDRLLAHDDAFFMEKSYDDLQSGHRSGFVEELKRLWTHMSEEDRRSVHEYLDLALAVHSKLSLGGAVSPASRG
eukprot:jgi/Tetstr1/464028/TSEL_008833.t1